MNWEIIGYVATICSGTHLIPEILKALRTHHLNDLAWGMLLLMTASSFLWLIYAIGNHIVPLGISSTLNTAFNIALVTLKVRYSKKRLSPAIQTVSEITEE